MRKTGDAVREFQSKATREKHRSIMQPDTLSPTNSQNVYQTTQQDFTTTMNNQNVDTLSDFMNGVNIAQVKPIA